MQPIDAIRDDLVRRRQTLLRQVDRIEGDLHHLDERVEPELEEEAQGANLTRVLAGLDERGNAELAAIDAALARIERGDYGRCEDCEEPIPVERFRALPTTTTCVLCSEARERRQA